MELAVNIKLFNFSSEEERKVKEKFLVSLALLGEESTEELKAKLAYLDSMGIKITHAREIKVLTIPTAELAKKIDIISGIDELDIYRNNPVMLTKNALDIYKKIKYCESIHKEYKNADGSYKSFLFSEKEWNAELSKTEEETVAVSKQPLDDETFSPFESLKSEDPEESLKNTASLTDGEKTLNVEFPEHVIDRSFINDDVNEIRQESLEEAIPVLESESIPTSMYDDPKTSANLDAKTANFASIRAELENQLAELETIRNDGTISFGDIEPDSYGRGRAA